MSAIEISLGSSAPIELELLATALIAELDVQAGMSERLVRDRDSGSDEALRVDGAAPVIVRSRPTSFVVSSDMSEREVPWFLPVIPPLTPRSRASNLRIGIAGGVEDRRLRMTWKTLAELRRRRFRFAAIVLGRCELPPSAEQRPDELHENPGPGEVLMALSRFDVVLECTDGFDTESFLAVAARDAGVPVAAHQERADLTRAGNPLAELWSADGFAEALQNAGRERVEPIEPKESMTRLRNLIGVG